MKNLGLLAFFAFVIITVGMVIGISFPPGEWYAALQKPLFTPLNGAFALFLTIICSNSSLLTNLLVDLKDKIES